MKKWDTLLNSLLVLNDTLSLDNIKSLNLADYTNCLKNVLYDADENVIDSLSVNGIGAKYNVDEIFRNRIDKHKSNEDIKKVIQSIKEISNKEEWIKNLENEISSLNHQLRELNSKVNFLDDSGINDEENVVILNNEKQKTIINDKSDEDKRDEIERDIHQKTQFISYLRNKQEFYLNDYWIFVTEIKLYKDDRFWNYCLFYSKLLDDFILVKTIILYNHFFYNQPFSNNDSDLINARSDLFYKLLMQMKDSLNENANQFITNNNFQQIERRKWDYSDNFAKLPPAITKQFLDENGYIDEKKANLQNITFLKLDDKTRKIILDEIKLQQESDFTKQNITKEWKKTAFSFSKDEEWNLAKFNTFLKDFFIAKIIENWERIKTENIKNHKEEYEKLKINISAERLMQWDNDFYQKLNANYSEYQKINEELKNNLLEKLNKELCEELLNLAIFYSAKQCETYQNILQDKSSQKSKDYQTFINSSLSHQQVILKEFIKKNFKEGSIYGVYFKNTNLMQIDERTCEVIGLLNSNWLDLSSQLQKNQIANDKEAQKFLVSNFYCKNLSCIFKANNSSLQHLVESMLVLNNNPFDAYAINEEFIKELKNINAKSNPSLPLNNQSNWTWKSINDVIDAKQNTFNNQIANEKKFIELMQKYKDILKYATLKEWEEIKTNPTTKWTDDFIKDLKKRKKEQEMSLQKENDNEFSDSLAKLYNINPTDNLNKKSIKSEGLWDVWDEMHKEKNNEENQTEKKTFNDVFK